MTSLRPDVDAVGEYHVFAERFADTVAVSDLSAQVPGCPGWSGYDLVVHLGNVHGWAATIVETGRRAPSQDDSPSSRRPRSVSRWYAGKAGDLLAVLRANDPTSPCWNFAGVDPSGGFWHRRQMLETAMHLVDLDSLSGRATHLSATVCAEGVGEVLEVFLPRLHARGHLARLTVPLTVRAEDTGQTWALQPAEEGAPTLTHVLEGDLASGGDCVEGSAEALWRMLWKRPARIPEVRFSGDPDRISAFLAGRLTP